MAARGLLKEFKERQRRLEKEPSSSTPNSMLLKRKIKRKNLLHGCKLCPEITFPVSAQSRTRPRNQSVEGHALKEHPDMDYTTLTRKWGYRVYYEDQTFENIPLIEHGDMEEEEIRAKARQSKVQGHKLDHGSQLSQDEKNLHMLLSAVQPASGGEHEGLFMESDSPQQAVLPASNNLCQQPDAPSYYAELSVLNLQLAEADTIDGIASPGYSQQDFINDLNDVIRERVISPFNPDEPFRNSTCTPVDPQLALQDELTNDILPPNFEQDQAQSMVKISENGGTLSNRCTLLPYRTQVQDTSESAHLAKQYQDQVDGHGSFSETSSSGFAEYDSTHTSLMQQMHSQHNSRYFNVSLEDSHARSHTFDLSRASSDQSQLRSSNDEQGVLYSNTEAATSSTGSFQDGHNTSAYPDLQTQSQSVVPEASAQASVLTHQFPSPFKVPANQLPSPFKVPATPASATRPTTKRTRSSRSAAKQSNPVDQPKTPTPSPQKRKASASHPQTPTPKSRRRRYAPAIPATPTTPQPSPNSRTQTQHSPSPTPPRPPQDSPFALPGPTPTPLQYCSAGPLVFPQVTFAELHTLDREALTGNHGPLVANLARLAFFGAGENQDVSRTREKQMMDMIGYLRLQREWFYVTGGDAREGEEGR